MYDEDAMDEMEDDNLTSFSLRQFCHRAKDLLSHDQTGFVRFVLTGQDTDGRQACVDPVHNRVTPDDSLRILRDYDSLLGIHTEIIINYPIGVSPVSKLDDTLSKNIHISYEFTTNRVSFSISCSS
jgi:uncharacterized protein (DUF1778 family)